MKKQPKLGLVLAAAALISVAVASLVSARGWVQEGAEWRYVDNDGEYVTGTMQSSGSSKFYLNDEGYMVKDYFLEDYNSNNYYFGSNGAMVTNTWVAIESSMTDNQGDYVPDNYWYYFQASGKAVKSNDSSKGKKMVIDGKKYMFNEYGQMCTGWITEEGKVIDPDTDDAGGPFVEAMYYAGGDNDGVLRSGWVTYYDGWNGDGEDYLTEKNTIYFYFNTSTNKKIGHNQSTTKKINGKTYAFDSTGIMLSGWDVVDQNGDGITRFENKTVYFSGEDDGHQVKKGWVYAVPAESVDESAYNDGEEKYFYFNANGEAAKDVFKKVNGKYYVFNPKGIMKTGLVLWCPATGSTNYSHFITTLDLDWAEGGDMSKKGKIKYDKNDNQILYLTYDGKFISADSGDFAYYADRNVKIHYFGDDGARKTGSNTVSFSDDDYTFNSNASGHRVSGKFSKKYYSLGIQLKASQDIKYGILAATPQWFKKQNEMDGTELKYAKGLNNGWYQVLNTSGSLQKKGSKKDADGNWWVMGESGFLYGIYSLEAKRTKITNLSTFFNMDWLKGTTLNLTSTASDIVDFTDLTGATASVVVNAFKTAYKRVDDTGVRDNFFTDNILNVKVKDKKITSVEIPMGFTFKSEFDSTTKAIPFGLNDDTFKTAKLAYAGDDADSWYQVTPNNDYFLNCYWDD